MVKYHFHILHNGIREEDPDCADIATLDLAIEEAIRAAREIMSERILVGDSMDAARFEIATEDGTVVQLVHFRSGIHPN
jgi:hypothetical protein